MSRTYRFRSPNKQPYPWGGTASTKQLERDWQEYLDYAWDWPWSGCNLNSKELAFKSRRARDRRDGRFQTSVPKSYRAWRNNILREKHRQQMRQCNDWDALILDPFIKDAGWYYF